jgi:hypothetical protein
MKPPGFFQLPAVLVQLEDDGFAQIEATQRPRLSHSRLARGSFR